MTISPLSGGLSSGGTMSKMLREKAANEYFDKLNEKFAKLKIKQGKYRVQPPSILETEAKVNVFMDKELLFEASQEEDLGNLLWDKTGKLADLQKLLEEKFSAPGQKLTESGFVVDKKGNIYCRGKAEIDGKEGSFHVKICNVKEKYVDMAHRLSSQFDIQALGVLNLLV